MSAFSLTRATIRDATGWRYHRVRTLIKKPYRLDSRFDPAGPKGGGRRERFRLGDMLTRCRERRNFSDEMALNLIAADAAYRKENTQ